VEEVPEDYEAAAGRFRKLARDAAGTKWALMAEDAIGEIEGQRRKAEEAEFARLKDEGRKLADAGDYDAALAGLARQPEKFAAALFPRLKAEAEGIRKEADERLGAVTAAAGKLSKDGEPEKASKNSGSSMA